MGRLNFLAKTLITYFSSCDKPFQWLLSLIYTSNAIPPLLPAPAH